MAVRMIRQKTVVEQVMHEIQALIASGKYPVSAQIPGENELAQMFGVSRPTIREALKVFNYLGVLRSQSGRGTYVADRANISTEALTWAILLGQDEVREMIEMREIIERRSIEKIMATMGSESARRIVDSLALCLKDMHQAAERGSLEDLNRLDFEFHRIVIEGSGNSLFSAIYSTLRSFMRIEIEQTHKKLDDLRIVESAHQDILEGIQSGDCSTALNAFHAHMQSRCFQVFNRTV